MSEQFRVTKGPLVEETYDRMVEIMRLATGTQSPKIQVEYSALICGAATLMAVSHGIQPTRENCRRILHLIADHVIPAIEAEVEKMS